MSSPSKKEEELEPAAKRVKTTEGEEKVSPTKEAKPSVAEAKKAAPAAPAEESEEEFDGDDQEGEDSFDSDFDEPEEEQIDVDFSSFFGVVPSRLAFTDSYTSILKRNQVFSKSLWVSVVEELHAAQERGRGIVSSLDLVTISNPWWGIAGGFKVSVTVVYLGRAAEWESRLSPGIRAVVTPASNPEDMTSLVDHGPFARFPHYRTTAGSLNFARANLLASFMGWVVLQHKDLFMKLLTDS